MGYGSDAEVVEAARDGRTDAMAEIYDRYGDRIYGFCLSLTRDPDRAADATQDTFVRAVRSLGQLRDPSRLRSWLFAIARNQVMGSARSEGRMLASGDPLEVEGIGEGTPDTAAPSDPVRQVIEDDMVRLVWDAAAGLDERDRLLLELNLRQGLEGAELAEAMGVEAGHGYVLLSRMKGRIEKSLGALLVARLGREDCGDLARLLADWDGRFSVRLRKRVVRHVDSCTVCSRSRSSLVAPAALFAAVPFIPSPVQLRERILGQMVLASANTPIGAPASSEGSPRAVARENGGVGRGPGTPRTRPGVWGGTLEVGEQPPPPPPPSPTAEQRRRRLGLWLSAAAVAVILLLGLLSTTGRARKGVVLASDRPTTTPAPSTTSVEAATVTSPPSPAPGPTSAPVTSEPPTTSAAAPVGTSPDLTAAAVTSTSGAPPPSTAAPDPPETTAPATTTSASTTTSTPSSNTTVPSTTTSAAPSTTTAPPTTASTTSSPVTSTTVASTTTSTVATTTTSPSTTTEPRGPVLRVAPGSVTLRSGTAGFRITDAGPGSADWTISSPEPTLEFSVSSGRLDEGATVSVTVYGGALNGPVTVLILGGVQAVSLTVYPEPVPTTTTSVVLRTPPTISIPSTTLPSPTLGLRPGP